MIFIVSLILTFGFALSALFIGFSPNIYRISDKDFMHRAIRNAELEAMHYGDLYLRAGIIDTDPNTTDIPDNTSDLPDDKKISSLFTYNIIGPNADQTVSFITITSRITASKDTSTGLVNITAQSSKKF